MKLYYFYILRILLHRLTSVLYVIVNFQSNGKETQVVYTDYCVFYTLKVSEYGDCAFQ
jgi:hypothetical protein